MEKIEKLKQTEAVGKICQFCEKPLFAVLLAALLALGYVCNLPILSIAVFALIASFCFLFGEDSRPALTVVLLAFFALRGKDQVWAYTTPFAFVVYALCGPLLIFSVIYRVVKHRVPMPKKRGLYCIIGLCIANLLGGLFSEYYTLRNFGYAASFSGAAFLGYLIFASTMKKREDNFLYLARVFAVAICLIALQILEVYIRLYEWGAPMDSAWKQKVVIGWGISNLIAEMIVFLLPAVFYLIYKEKRGYLYWIVVAVGLIAVYFTFGRNALLWGVVCTLVGTGINFFAGENKKVNRFIVLGVAILGIALLILLYSMGKLDKLTAFFTQEKMGDRGRYRLWGLHVKFFAQSPLNGLGFQAYASLAASEINPVTYAHNVVVQFLGSTGIIGMILYLLYNGHVFRIIFKKLTMERLFFGGCIVAGIAMSMLSPFFFLPYVVFYNVIMQMTLEKSYEE